MRTAARSGVAVEALVQIVHVIQRIELSQGGVVRSVLDLAASLVKRGHGVSVLTCRNVDGPSLHEQAEAGLRIVELPGAPKPWRSLSPAVRDAVGAEVVGADLVHYHAVWSPVHLAVGAVAGRAGVPGALSLHGMLDTYPMRMKPVKKRAFLALYGGRLIGDMRAIHCTSRTELEESRRWFGAAKDRARVIPLALDVEPYERSSVSADEARRSFGLGEDPFVLFLGRVHPIKSLPLLVEAVSVARETVRDVRLVIAGDHESADETEAVRRLASRLGIADWVHLVGVVHGDLKVSLLRAANVLALPSHHENFGMVVPEAMICDTPVVVSKGVGLWPDVEEHDAGLVVTHDVGAMAGALRTLLSEPETAQRFARNGAGWVRERLSGDAVLSRYEQMYDDVRSGKP